MEDMKRARENISLYELRKDKSQKNIFLKDLGYVHKSPLSPVTLAKKGKYIMNQNLVFDIYINPKMIGERSNSLTPSFLPTFEILKKMLTTT